MFGSPISVYPCLTSVVVGLKEAASVSDADTVVCYVIVWTDINNNLIALSNCVYGLWNNVFHNAIFFLLQDYLGKILNDSWAT